MNSLKNGLGISPFMLWLIERSHFEDLCRIHTRVFLPLLFLITTNTNSTLLSTAFITRLSTALVASNSKAHHFITSKINFIYKYMQKKIQKNNTWIYFCSLCCSTETFIHFCILKYTEFHTSVVLAPSVHRAPLSLVVSRDDTNFKYLSNRYIALRPLVSTMGAETAVFPQNHCITSTKLQSIP